MFKTKTAADAELALKKTDAFIFDIDGTLLLTRDLVHWNGLHRAMLEVYGVDANLDGVPYHGKTDIAILRSALLRKNVSEEMFYKRLEHALAIICREVAEHAQEIDAGVCPAVPKLLANLDREKRLVAVASGNLETVGWLKLTAAGLRKYFQFGCFGDRCEQRRDIFRDALEAARHRLGSEARVAFVGDTPDDIFAARHVGAYIIAVSTGVFSFQELSALEPDVCSENCADLLQQWHGIPGTTSPLRQLSTSRILG